MKREYIVTLKNKEDLKSFYEDMETSGGTNFVPDREVGVKDRRPVSRNTNYLLTDDEAKELEKDERVLSIELSLKERGKKVQLFSSYTVSGNFDKTPDSGNGINWAILHCAGNDSQRGKGTFGIGQDEEVSDEVTVFNDGSDIDVVIVDTHVAHDHQEFLDPDTNQTRFIQYQWFNELDQYMVDLETEETDQEYQNFIDNNLSNIPYYSCSQLSNGESHGTHVAGIATGKTQGWARKSNIYSIALSDFGGEFPNDKIFDYLRVFHKNKGTENPTVTNHSWGSPDWEIELTSLSEIHSVFFRGQLFENSQGDWDEQYIESNFGIQVFKISGVPKLLKIPVFSNAIVADVEDAIKDGVIVVSAAGNSTSYSVPEGHVDYDNSIRIKGNPKIDGITRNNYDNTFYINRGRSPQNSPNIINVGSIGVESDFRKDWYSDYGPSVDVFAPGTSIMSSYPGNNTSTYASLPGTSMAAPQVVGIIACFCTNKNDVNNHKAMQYINEFGKRNDMIDSEDFDNITTLRGAPNLYILAVDRRKKYSVFHFNDYPRKNQNVLYPRKKTGKK